LGLAPVVCTRKPCHLPSTLASVSDRYRVPVVAILVHAGVAWVLAAGTFTELALVAGGAICLVYIAGCAAAWDCSAKTEAITATPFVFAVDH